MEVLYLCDKKRCSIPCFPGCNYTKDIAHAVNFELYGNTYREKKPSDYNSCNGCMWEGLGDSLDAPCDGCCRNFEEDYFEPMEGSKKLERMERNAAEKNNFNT